MPKFRINCYTTIPYILVVEAPNQDAAEAFYDASDGGEFRRCEEGGWELEDIYEIGENEETADVTVDAEGHKVEEG